jgi:BlaI family transcriptional regulator, penicillinase repressor
VSDRLPHPTNAELEILKLLWTAGPQTVREVHDEIKKRRPVRYTTVLKLLQIMAEKGLVERDETARSHVYGAAADETAVTRHLVRDLVDRAFEGSAAKLVMQALAAKPASSRELREIREMLERLNRRSS